MDFCPKMTIYCFFSEVIEWEFKLGVHSVIPPAWFRKHFEEQGWVPKTLLAFLPTFLEVREALISFDSQT